LFENFKQFARVSHSVSQHREDSIAGRHVLLVGKLASMSRREAERIVSEHGGAVVDRGDATVDLIVANDEAADLGRLAADREMFDDTLRARIAGGEVELVGESALWSRLGLVESGQGIARLYTPAMLAELVGAPVAAIRQWHRCGALIAHHEIRRLAYFDFEEVGVARKLAQLLSAGCSLTVVNRKLAELARLLPDIARPLADPEVVVEGRQLLVRRAGGVSLPGGQLLIDFGRADPSFERLRTAGQADDEAPATISMMGAASLHGAESRPRGVHPYAADDMRALAAELEGSGQGAQAMEAYRAVLFSGDSTAEDHFALAELLYQASDLSAARERYYAAIELDEDFVEARSNLGCVLVELGEFGLAEAAFRGALEYHPDYADSHYHLARLLDREGRSAEAVCHWRLFMSLAPASPWVDEARERVGSSRLSAVSSRRDAES
jgi:tetratricopeptide (TPR) repeat protein